MSLIKFDKEELIENYFNKTLTSESSMEFKNQFYSDAEFRKMLADEFLFRKILSKAAFQDMEERLQEFDSEQNSISDETSKNASKKTLKWLTLIVVIILTLFLFYYCSINS